MALQTAESRHDYLKTYGAAALLTLAGFFVAYQFVEPAPPSTIVMSTGGVDGAYHRFAGRYAAALASDGVKLMLKSSAGSVENIARLTNSDAAVEVALVQGGVSGAREYPALRALGSVYYEPLWLFYRGTAPLHTLRELRGRRVAVGAPGSGTRAVMAALLGANELSFQDLDASELNAVAAAQALQRGELDAAAFVASPKATAVRLLVSDTNIRLMSFARAEAYARLHPFLNRVVLPRGAISLSEDLPRNDVQLLAPAATLVARDTLHPALIDLLLRAAVDVHSEGALFERPGEFPSPRFVDFELSDEARRFYRSGPPFLQRYLPFWAANLVDRMKVLILPLITVLFPLFKIVPPFYSWRVRRRISRWYRDVRDIEIRYLLELDESSRKEGLARLDQIDRELIELKVPLAVSDSLYHLRLHTRFVRDELNASPVRSNTNV